MKTKLLLLLSLIVIFVIIIIAKFFLLQSQAIYGKIQVLTSPQSKVFLNNEEVGTTPYEGVYKSGEYILELKPIEKKSKSVGWKGKISVYTNAWTYVNRELGSDDSTSSGIIFSIKKMDSASTGISGEVEIQTNPSRSQIIIDNEDQGLSPLILSGVEKGHHELSAYSVGFLKRTQKIKVTPGYRIIAQFKLAIDPLYKKGLEPENETKIASESGEITPTKSGVIYATIKETETGWLRVRQEPNAQASESAKVKPGDQFEVLEENEGWIKIEYSNNNFGWISGRYVSKSTQ